MHILEQALQAHRNGDLATAEHHYVAALTHDPNHIDALHCLGLLYQQYGRDSLAVSLLERAVSLRPQDAILHLNLGVTYKACGQLELAIACFTRAVTLSPTLAAGHYHIGNIHLISGRLDEAIESFRVAVRLNPGNLAALNGLGETLHSMERCREAMVAFRAALALDPKSLTARLGAGTAMYAMGNYHAAIAQLEMATELDPRCPAAWLNLGCARLALGDYYRAVNAFSQTLKLQPGLATAHLNRALAWLSAGDFARGLPEYEWRAKATHQPSAPSFPRWNGNPLGEEILLIQAEQGLGDTLHFLRFVPLAREKASRIVLQVQAPLLPLLKPKEQEWDIIVVGPSECPPQIDLQCPLLSLPLILGVTLDALPAAAPYIRVPENYREKWRNALGHLGKRKIGLAWSGHIRPHENRAVPLAKLKTLFAREDIEWVVLQRDVSAPDRSILESHPHTARIHRFDDRITDLADTAAIMEQLDAVVSIDTAIAHLAGAMGKPLWILLPFAADWRWHIDTMSSRWYPSAQLVRQEYPGQWEWSIGQIAKALAHMPTTQ
ncbi:MULTISPECIES: tetratricopeptide repeat protein [Cupriavidus]